MVISCIEQLYTTDKELLWRRVAEFLPVMRKTGEWRDYAGVVVLCNYETLTRGIAQWAGEQKEWIVNTSKCHVLRIISKLTAANIQINILIRNPKAILAANILIRSYKAVFAANIYINILIRSHNAIFTSIY